MKAARHVPGRMTDSLSARQDAPPSPSGYGRAAFVSGLPAEAAGAAKAGSNGLFEFLRGAERDLLARLDLDRFAGRGVAAHAGGALANLQDAEAADADPVALL